MITVSSMKVTGMPRRLAKPFNPHAPLDPGELHLLAADQLDPCLPEKGHWEITGHANPIAVIPDVHGESFDKVLAAIPIVERPRAEKQGDGRINGRLRTVIPGNPQERSRKSHCLAG